MRNLQMECLSYLRSVSSASERQVVTFTRASAFFVRDALLQLMLNDLVEKVKRPDGWAYRAY